MSQCLARKKSNPHQQCSRKCLVGFSFCRVHQNMDHVISIHDPLPENTKSPKLKKTTEILQYSDITRVNISKISIAQIRNTLQYYNIPSIPGSSKKVLIQKLKGFLSILASLKSNIDKVIRIQNWFRKQLIKEVVLLRGPGIDNLDSCVNTEDVISLDSLATIPRYLLLTYQDKTDNLVYGFDIRSIISILKNDKKNPYNTRDIDQITCNKIYRLQHLLKVLNICIDRDDEDDILDSKTKSRHRIIHIFHEMDSLDQYTNPEWFFDLSLPKLKKFYKELEDIWNYRLNLTKETKSSIVPPMGKVFYDKIPYVLSLKNYDQVLNICLNTMEKLITSANKRADRVNGCIYVLLALVLVNKDAAMSLPTLYSMVAPDDVLFAQQQEFSVLI